MEGKNAAWASPVGAFASQHPYQGMAPGIARIGFADAPLWNPRDILFIQIGPMDLDIDPGSDAGRHSTPDL